MKPLLIAVFAVSIATEAAAQICDIPGSCTNSVTAQAGNIRV